MIPYSIYLLYKLVYQKSAVPALVSDSTGEVGHALVVAMLAFGAKSNNDNKNGSRTLDKNPFTAIASHRMDRSDRKQSVRC